MSTHKSVLTVVFTIFCALSACVLPVVAGAYATAGPPPVASPSSGLPDGRVYELTTPFNKHGYQDSNAFLGNQVGDSVASPDGNAVSFEAKGPAGENDSSGTNFEFVAERTVAGWTSRAATARGLYQNEKTSGTVQLPTWLDYSPSLSRLVYDIGAPEAGGDVFNGYQNLYLMGSDPFAEPTWLLREAIKIKGSLSEQHPEFELLGMSPDASTVYIADESKLLPQDISRSGWGIYEYRAGKLSEAGTLPDGSVPASGAYPPMAVEGEVGGATNYGLRQVDNPASLDNQVSENGSRMFFVSSNELYVHEIEASGSERSVLVSASQTAGHVGEAAPDGVTIFENRAKSYSSPKTDNPTYAYATPDGSHVFFESVDQLTDQAPGGAGPKVYDFDVDSGSLEYLPEMTLGGIVTATSDGSSVVFVNKSGSSADLDLWSSGPVGGSVKPIAQLPGGGFVGPGRMVAGNTVLVFQAQAPIPGFNNTGGEQVYRYDIGANQLDCISCPPAGVTPSGNAFLSTIDQYRSGPGLTIGMLLNDARGVSSDGKRIFFSSPDPLVGKDINGTLDAYEWEDGTVYLLSTGSSSEPSTFLDNSISGGDAFFATTEELVPGDNDGGVDVYDARIPRPGDSPPAPAAPCSGSACQGPPSVPQLLDAPPSAIFNGLGNIAEEKATSTTRSAPKPISRAHRLSSALRACQKRRTKAKRACEKQARKRSRTAEVRAKYNRGRGK